MSIPPGNQRTNGARESSRTRSNGRVQEIACSASAQNPSGSRSDRSYARWYSLGPLVIADSRPAIRPSSMPAAPSRGSAGAGVVYSDLAAGSSRSGRLFDGDLDRFGGVVRNDDADDA